MEEEDKNDNFTTRYKVTITNYKIDHANKQHIYDT